MFDNLLSRTQADELFEQESVLFGALDGVPEYRLVDLFGEDALQFVRRIANCNGRIGDYFNGFGIGDYTATYFTKRGFLTAVTYSNVSILHDRVRSQQE